MSRSKNFSSVVFFVLHRLLRASSGTETELNGAASSPIQATDLVDAPPPALADSAAAVIVTRTSKGGIARAVALITNSADSDVALDLAYFDRGDCNSALAAVDAFEFVQNYSVTHGRKVDLYISNKAVRDWFEAQQHSHLVPRHFNGQRESTVRSAAEVLLERRTAAEAAADATPARQILVRPPMPLVIATDASARTGHRGVGIAYVTETGAWRQEFLPSVSEIAVGELDAIHLALADNAHHTRVEIITDSLNSIRWIEGTRPVPTHLLAGRVRQIRALCAGRTVEFQWVKSHAGHRLNDTADRLAVAARRNGTAAIASDAREHIARNIMDDFHASTPAPMAVR